MIDINSPRLIGDPIITEISENIMVETQNYIFRYEKYTDVILINILTNEQYFIGRFKEPQSKVKILFNDGKILVYNDKYNYEKNNNVITNVLALYSILDDSIYAETEENALNIFNKDLDSSFLENKDRLLIEIDIERKNKTLIRV